MSSGVYCITINDMYYVGSAKDFDVRLARHLKDLQNGNHHNVILQRCYDKHGEDYIHFEILEKVPYDKNFIVEREQYYINEYRNVYKNRCCNLADATFGDTLSNHPNRDCIIEKRTRALKEKNLKMGVQGRKIAYGRNCDKNGMFGKSHSKDVIKALKERCFSDDTRKKMSHSAKQKFENMPELKDNLSRLASGRTGEKNPFYGKKHSEKTKKKIAIKNKGRKPVNTVKISIDNVEYDSYNDASRKLNIPVVTIRHRCLSENKKFENYIVI